MGNKVSGRPEDSFPFLPTVEQERKLCHQTSKDLLNGEQRSDALTWLDKVVLSRSQSGTTLSELNRRPRDRVNLRASVVYEPVIEEKTDCDEVPDDNQKGEPLETLIARRFARREAVPVHSHIFIHPHIAPYQHALPLLIHSISVGD